MFPASRKRSMDLLHELVYVVELSPSRSFPLLLPENSKLRTLYDMVRQNEFLTDEGAAEQLYQCAPSDKRYLMLKRNLVSKLSELILISELGDTETSSVKFHLEQRLTVAEKLLLQNVYHNAEKIGKRVRKDAMRESLTDVHLRALHLLRRVYALKGDHKAYQQNATEYLEINQQSRDEDLWLQAVQEIESTTKYTVATLPNLISSLRASTPPENNLHQIKSRFAQFNFLKLKVYQAHHNYHITLMDEPLMALESLIGENSTLDTTSNTLFWLNYRIRYQLSLGRFEGAHQNLMRARALSSFQAFDRFEIEELWYIYHTRQLQLTQAAAVIDSVIRSPQYDRLHVLDRNLWYVRAAYLHWCTILLGKESISVMQGHFTRFKLDDLYQHTTSISKDKTGGNLHVMLLRGLFTLLDPEATARAYDTGNTLVVYYQRYLKDYPEERIGLFFRSIAKLLKRQEDTEKVERLDQKFVEGMETSALRYDLNEWIPFQKLWRSHILPRFSP